MKKKWIWPALALLLAVTLATGTSFAWLSKEQPADGIFTTLSDFEVTGELTFDGKVYSGNQTLVPISFLPNGENYIGGMKYVIKYTGASPAYIRVQVLEQWVDINTNEILSASYLPYHLTGEVTSLNPSGTNTRPAASSTGAGNDLLALKGVWVDNRKTDYCFYYSVPVQPKNLAVTAPESAPGSITAIGDGSISLTLIDQPAGNTDALLAGIDPSTTQLMLLFQVEAVQPNRFREFFGIDAIPKP